MVATPDLVADLELALQRVGASATLVSSRVAPSTLYDADYHLAIIACGFNVNATNDTGVRRILRGWLKLLQFVAARPRLVDDLVYWAGNRLKPNLESWRRMPRGYVGDQTHDAVVDLLIAHHALTQDAEHIVEGSAIRILDGIYENICAADLFVNERRVMSDFKALRVNRTMLGGG